MKGLHRPLCRSA